jgi:putative ABC transport system permease protein
MTPLFRKLMWWFQRRRKEDELREELQFHLEEEADERRAEGLPEDQARRAARRDLGNVTLLWEDTRTLWTWSLLEQLAQDTRYALRALRRSPGFAAVAILTLALGIGVNTAIFSVINAVVLRPLPYRDPATLLLIDTSPLISAPTWLTAAWRDRARTLSDFAGFNDPRAATLVHGGSSQQIDAANVTWNFLSFLGVAPVIGRDFAATDADRGAAAVGILSHEFWRNAFGSDQAIVGKTLTVTGNPVTIVGVAPAGFRFPTRGTLPATGMPTDTQPDVLRVANADASVNVIGRLAPGSTPASATGELLAIFKQEAGTRFRGDAVERWELHAAPLQDRLVGSVRQRLWLVLGAVGFVLLVACANVANLLLARASTRQRELALRMALGARKGRVACLVLTETILLALLGSAAALVFAYTTSEVARTLLADRIPHVDGIAIDARVLAFNLAVAAATGMLCGLVSLPGIRRLSVAAIFASGAPAVAGRSRIRRLLLSAETAVTFVLVVGAALFMQTLWNLSAQDRGFDADRLLTVRVSTGLPPDLDRSERRAGSRFFAVFFSELRDRLERLPGVTSAGAVSLGPLDGISSGFTNIAVNGRTVSSQESLIPVAFVTPGYFRTMRIPVIGGRDFNEGDRLGADLVAIVNEAFQRRFAATGDILGARVTSGSGPEAFTIVGVTQDVPDRSLRQAPEPLLMAPLAQMPGVHISWSALTFVLRTAESDPLRLAPEVRRTIWAVNPNIVIVGIATMNARVAVGMRAERDSALLFGLFALAALAMAAIGVYGVAAYTIAQRTKEIGIRVALGAARHDVRRLVVSQTLWPTLIGISVGVAAAAMLTRLVASMVYGVTPLDPATFAVGIVVLVSVALAATWMPARRAIRIDPLVALRCE